MSQSRYPQDARREAEQWLHALLRDTVRRTASDLFLKTGAAPSMRIDGTVVFLKAPAASEKLMLVLADTLLGGRIREFNRDGEADLAYELDGVERFRVNIFRQRGQISAAFRHVAATVPTFEELHLPARQLQHLASQTSGIVLVTGVTGSGKSTTLASMVSYMNQHFRRHIVTIEDPIEFVYHDNLCLIEQREVGIDTASFEQALKHVVRQSPDVILIGEMRDRTTIETAINAAEIGHLVLTTLHTANTAQTLERIVSYFPPHHHDLIHAQLATTLQGVLAQKLLPRKDGKGRVPVMELMMRSPTVADLIHKNQVGKLEEFMREDSFFGSQTFNAALAAMVRAGTVDLEAALAASPRPQELKNELQGLSLGNVSRGGGRRKSGGPAV